MRIAKNEDVMRLLDFLFGHRAAVYTSLDEFKYQTTVGIHRTTRAVLSRTFPPSMFFGVWTAFETSIPTQDHSLVRARKPPTRD